MDHPAYSLEHGSYYFKTPSGEILSMSDEVAIAFSAEDFIMFKHGRPASVSAWVARQNLPAHGRLIILQGKIPID